MRALLLTGRPGVGKTTVIRKVAEALPCQRLGGFYTEEVREHGRRRGFRAVTFDSWTRMIADIGHLGPAR
ncbi:MAG: AAA family ATPase, partial [bacterium]|nr:AAA family ATPase [bacterium]